MDYCVFFFAVSGSVMSCIEREISHKDGIESHKFERILILSVVFVMSLFMGVCIYMRYTINLRLQQHKGDLHIKDDLWTTGQWKIVLLEIVTFVICPMPWFWDKTVSEDNINYDVRL